MTTQKPEPAHITLEDNEAEGSYPPIGTPETALLVVIDSENFKILAHTGRYFHGTCVCAGYTGEYSGLCGVPDEPGFYFFYDGKVWSSRCWETGVIDDWGIEGEFRKATPEDFSNAGLECPMDFPEKNNSTDLYTAACAERDALRALCEGMVGKIKKLKMYTSDIESVHPAYDGEYGEWVRTDDVHEVITAYEKHKAGE